MPAITDTVTALLLNFQKFAGKRLAFSGSFSGRLQCPSGDRLCLLKNNVRLTNLN